MVRVLGVVGFFLLACYVSNISAGGIETQDERAFTNFCENCTVSAGMGFAPDPTDCSCYYTCVLRRAEKLASYSNPWVSYLRCCPCRMTFSSKLLTCVDYTDKRSDCYKDILNNNECVTPNTLISRSDPDFASGASLCAGFKRCTFVGGTLVPEPDCCTEGNCFESGSGTCTEAACGSCPKRNTDDCECVDTPEPISECAFVSMSSSIFQFMGRENMKTYDCAPGTCWDQNLCTCVRTNNTGYNNCGQEFAQLDFNGNDPYARDQYGNIIYTTISEEVDVTGSEADFSGGNVTVSGLANTWLSNLFTLRFEFEMDSLSFDDLQCLVGTCTEITGSEGEDSLQVLLNNVENGLDQVIVSLTYKDSDFWVPGAETTETVTLTMSSEMEPGFEQDLYLFFGYEEMAMAGVFEGSTLLDSSSAEVDGNKGLINPRSGFIFGQCVGNNPYLGEMDSIELYRNCEDFPPPSTTLATRYDAVRASFSGP